MTIKCLFEQIRVELSTEFSVWIREPEWQWKAVPYSGSGKCMVAELSSWQPWWQHRRQFLSESTL